MKEKYEKQKIDNPNCLILIKSGNFYVTFNDDAYIMNQVFDYQVLKEKIGFPITSIGKVKDKLDVFRINYLIIDSDENIIKKSFDDNQFNQILINYKKQEYKDNMKKLLFDRIEYLINLDYDNYDKIRKFIDEF